MKIENWIVTAGIGFLLIMSVLAFLPEELLDSDIISAPVSNAANSAPEVLMNSVPQWGAPGVIDPMVMGQAGPMVAAARKTAAPLTNSPGQRDFERASSVRFAGIIQQVSELQQHDGQIHIWVDNARGAETRVSVGPSWFLKYTGCTIAHDITVSGVGFLFDRAGRDPLVYAQKIVIDGKKCRLRNDEGFALWSNRLR